ncbi:MAG: DMT family transporter [Muribaculaceae bacterium]|nr:DMT family transporter [Muribaculaceae bacterium]
MATAEKSIWQRPLWVAIFAFTAAFVWGWAYPLIKLGFEEFGITKDQTGSKMLFAGVRFAISGLIILAMAKGTNRNFSISTGAKGWIFILIFALLNTSIHYACFYIGLSHSAGSRAAILNSLSVFSLVLLACAVYPATDKLNLSKVAGCALGFVGILALNIGGADSGEFTWLGDGMIIGNALCSAAAGLMTRKMKRHMDVFVGTGYSLLFGGILLAIPGIAIGGTFPILTVWGLGILMMLIVISTLGFGLYNKLLSCNPVGKVAIFNSLIPVIGAISSCACLGEPFYWKYALAAVLAAGGIFVINRAKK